MATPRKARAAEELGAAPAKPKGYLTIEEFLQEYGIARSTYNDWKLTGRAPVGRKMPNGQIRLRRVDVEDWWNSLPEAG